MQDDGLVRSLAALRRKLRALAAVASDSGATPPERANAAALKRHLEQRLRQAGAPAGDWSDQAFRLGRWARQLHKTGPSEAEATDWTDHARRFGRALGRGYRKWTSE